MKTAQDPKKYNNIAFAHFVEIEKPNAYFAVARDKTSGKLHLFLVSKKDGKILVRNAFKKTWDEMVAREDYDRIQRLINYSLANRTVPMTKLKELPQL